VYNKNNTSQSEKYNNPFISDPECESQCYINKHAHESQGDDEIMHTWMSSYTVPVFNNMAV